MSEINDGNLGRRSNHPVWWRTIRLAIFGIAALTLPVDASAWKWTRWKVDCRDPVDCEPANEVYAELLENASHWLEELGFDPPRVTKHKAVWDEEGNPLPDGVMYWYAEVSDEKNKGKDTEYLGIYFDTSKELYLRNDAYFALGEPGQVFDDPWYGLEESKTFTPVHELFHAIEASYHNIGGTERDWIWEGAADTVLRAYADRFESELRVAQSARVTWDQPLHKPPEQSEAYGTWPFWRSIGMQIDSPSTIQYLRDVLAQDLDENRGLNGVDRALAASGGLYKLLPKFFSELDIQKGYFGSVDRIQVVMPPGETRHVESFGSAVNEVAGNPHELKVKANAGGKPLELEIRFKENHDNLHLIVEGTPYDSAGSHRNVYRDLLLDQNQKKLDIIVANVERNLASADDQSGTTRQQDYELEVSLRQVDWCTMTARVTGEVSGSYFGDIAHFSTTGLATMYGSFTNPEMIEGVGEFLANMAEVAGVEGAGDELRQTAAEWKASAGEMPRETFGLSLMDLKLDGEDDEALAFLAGGFSLEASSFSPEVGEEVTGNIPLKYMRVVPGPRAESTLDKVPFVWVDGGPGSAQLFLTRNTGDLVAGRVAGTLYSEGYYKSDGEPLVIMVQASFVALPGPTGCMIGGMGF